MRVMRLLVIASLPPATEGGRSRLRLLSAAQLPLTNFIFPPFFPSSHQSHSGQSHDGKMQHLRGRERSICLAFPSPCHDVYSFFLSHHSSSLRPVRENAMCFVQVDALEPGVEHGSPNTWIISSCLHCNRWAQARQAILEHNADVANKVDGLQNLCWSWL